MRADTRGQSRYKGCKSVRVPRVQKHNVQGFAKGTRGVRAQMCKGRCKGSRAGVRVQKHKV